MRLTVVAVASCCASAHALSTGSPFLMFSTSELFSSADQNQLQTSSQVLTSAKDFLSTCPTNRYLLISQPNLSANHLRSRTSAPKLLHALESETVKGQLSVAEVAGEIDIKQLSQYIKDSCKTSGKTSSVDEYELPGLPVSGVSSKIGEVLKENDDNLGVVLAQYEREGDYSIIYTSGSSISDHESKQYKPEFTDPTHMELKRQLGSIVMRANNTNNTNGTSLPLFEKYQFFTPGIFMGLIATFFLLSILFVGISALGSLEVSYGAFDKEMGPAAQKKQQ